MKVLVIRAHQRFAICRKVRLAPPAGTVLDGLLIELSLQGCRISSLGDSVLAEGDRVRVSLTGAEPFHGVVRWRREGTVGLRLESPFHTAELDALLRLCRGEDGAGARCFGT